jgi:hypothetical protein
MSKLCVCRVQLCIANFAGWVASSHRSKQEFVGNSERDGFLPDLHIDDRHCVHGVPEASWRRAANSAPEPPRIEHQGNLGVGIQSYAFMAA